MHKLLVLLLLPILLCSCMPYFLNPISDVRDAYVDERLTGTWVREHETGKDIVHVGKDVKNGMKFVFQEQASNYAIEVIPMFVTKTTEHS